MSLLLALSSTSHSGLGCAAVRRRKGEEGSAGSRDRKTIKRDISRG